LLNVALIVDLITGGFPANELKFNANLESTITAIDVAIPMVIVGLLVDKIPTRYFQNLAQDMKIFVLSLFGRSSPLPNAALAALLVSIGAGIAEEILFRGVLLQLINRAFGPTPALLVSSAIFGLAHFPGYS